MSAAGGVLDPAGIAISTAANNQSTAAVAWNGTDFLVVWQDERPGASNYDIYGSRVSVTGTVLDPAGIPISTAANYQAGPALAWNGTNFLVVWGDQRSGSFHDIYGARVSGGGSVLDPTGIAISTATNYQLAPVVASWSGSFLVAWQDRRSGTDYDIYGTGVSAGGVVQQPAGVAISTAAGDQDAPDVAVRYDFLVVWRDRRSGTGYDVYGTRISPAGVVEDPSGFVVAAATTDEGAPAVAGGAGANWRVAYGRFSPDALYGAQRVFVRNVAPK